MEYDIEPVGDQLFVVHNAGRVNFELAVAPITSTTYDDWMPLPITSEDEYVTGVDGFDDFIAVTLRRSGGTGIRIVLRDPTSPNGLGESHDISLGEPIHTLHVASNPETNTPSLQIVHESLVTPRTVEDYDVRSRAFTLLKAQRVRGDVDLGQYRQRREWATAADGTRIPISIVHRHDVVADGTAPGLLHGYGCVRHPERPVVLGAAPVVARPGLGLRHRSCSRRLRDGPLVV